MSKLFLKAKYKRRWKGKDGKWNYEYNTPQGKKKDVKLPPHLQEMVREADKQGITFTRPEPKSKDPAVVIKETSSDEVFAQSDKKKTAYTYSQYEKISKEYGVAHDLKTLRQVYGRRNPGEGVPLEIASKADFTTLYNNTTMAMISAGRNPMNKEDMKLTDAQIDARTKDLEADLVKAGYVYTPAEGKYGNPEHSFMVLIHHADPNEMFDLGAKYNQDSVAFSDRGKNRLLMTTGEKKGQEDMAGAGFTVIDKPSPDDDYYTDIPVAGKKMRFTLLMESIKKALKMFFRVGI